nr:glycosyltransferase family 39 protein [Bacteroidota bacterium]
MIEKLRQNPNILYISGIILLIPALLINLGLVNIYLGVDEATRALVAVEMMIRENFIVPTINGEYYYNKPPLFNWILAGMFGIFGFDEFVMRLPTVISLIGFGFTVYYFVGKNLGKEAGIITAFIFVTTGRLLFWESFFAYIDTTFSWTVYAGMMFTWHFFKQKKYFQLFIVSYIFAAIAFMLKGLPAIVFQGITLLVLFISEKEWKKLFSFQHVLGGLVFIVIVGGYYLIYHQYNSLENVFATLWGETTQRTVVDQGWWSTVKHLFEFPLEMTYHYAPWTFLIIFTFRKGFWKTVLKNKFLKFNLLVFLFNIIPYWTSPDVYPKYIMMLMPMLLTVYVYFYMINRDSQTLPAKIFEWVLMAATFILTIGTLIFPFVEIFSFSDFR